jgi:hypothetical protein
MASYTHSARRSLRLRLLVLLLVPLLSLAALWAFAAYLTAQDAFEKIEASTTYRKVAMPATALAATLQQERVVAAVLVSTGGKARGGVTTARAATDAAPERLPPVGPVRPGTTGDERHDEAAPR